MTLVAGNYFEAEWTKKSMRITKKSRSFPHQSSKVPTKRLKLRPQQQRKRRKKPPPQLQKRKRQKKKRKKKFKLLKKTWQACFRRSLEVVAVRKSLPSWR